MDPQAEQAAMQMADVFQSVLPMLDRSLQLEPDPRHPKRRKDQGKPERRGDGASTDNKANQMQEALRIMATLLIRQDQDLQCLKRNDSFMLYFSKEPSGTLAHLMKAAERWRQQMEQPAPSTLRQPLRTQLMITLLNNMLTRVTEVSKSKPGEKLFLACVKNRILLEDHSWPYLHWCHLTKQYLISDKKAVGMKQMLDMCAELLEHFRNPQLVLKFHALQNKPTSQTVPWRLQLQMRMDAPFELMTYLCRNSVWALLGTQLQPHLQQQTPLVAQLQEMLGKSKGKGKHKTNSTSTTASPSSALADTK